jgi:hypothetical protein
VDDLTAERDRLDLAGLRPSAPEDTKDFRIVRLNDPDGNLIVLAGAR